MNEHFNETLPDGASVCYWMTTEWMPLPSWVKLYGKLVFFGVFFAFNDRLLSQMCNSLFVHETCMSFRRVQRVNRARSITCRLQKGLWSCKWGAFSPWRKLKVCLYVEPPPHPKKNTVIMVVGGSTPHPFSQQGRSSKCWVQFVIHWRREALTLEWTFQSDYTTSAWVSKVANTYISLRIKAQIFLWKKKKLNCNWFLSCLVKYKGTKQLRKHKHAWNMATGGHVLFKGGTGESFCQRMLSAQSWQPLFCPKIVTFNKW